MKLMGAARESEAGLEFVTVAPKVFLSYRRADTLDVAQGLSKSLREDLGGTNVFRDEEDLIGGQPWQDVLTDTIKAADATLVLIGDRWVGERPDGTRRIDDPDDPVSSEVRDALKDGRSGSPIPVLVDIAEPPTSLPDELPSLFDHHAVKVTRERLQLPVSVEYKQVLVSVWEALRGRQVRGVLVAGTSHAQARIEELVAQLRAEGVLEARTLSRFASGVVIASARRAKRGGRRWPQVIVVVEAGDERDEGSVALIDALYRHPAIKNVALVAAGAAVGVGAITALTSNASACGTTASTHTASQLGAALPHSGSGITGALSTSWSNASGVTKLAVALGSALAVITAGVVIPAVLDKPSSSAIEFADTTTVSVRNDPSVPSLWPYPLGQPSDAVVRLGSPTTVPAPAGKHGKYVSRRVSLEIPGVADPIDLGEISLPTSTATPTSGESNRPTVYNAGVPPVIVDAALAGRLPAGDACADPANPDQVWAGWRLVDGPDAVTAQFFVVEQADTVRTEIAVEIEGSGHREVLPRAPAANILDQACSIVHPSRVGYYSDHFVRPANAG